MNTKQLDTNVGLHFELESDMVSGKNNGEINRLQTTSTNEGLRSLIDYKGQIYSLEIKPTYMAVDDKPDDTGDRAAFESHQRSKARR